MKNLRNYAGAQQYLHGYSGFPQKDAIATMRFMRHKKLETTLHYIRSMNLDEPTEYTTVAIQYANAGYSFFDKADGFKYYRIRK